MQRATWLSSRYYSKKKVGDYILKMQMKPTLQGFESLKYLQKYREYLPRSNTDLLQSKLLQFEPQQHLLKFFNSVAYLGFLNPQMRNHILQLAQSTCQGMAPGNQFLELCYRIVSALNYLPTQNILIDNSLKLQDSQPKNIVSIGDYVLMSKFVYLQKIAGFGQKRLPPLDNRLTIDKLSLTDNLDLLFNLSVLDEPNSLLTHKLLKNYLNSNTVAYEMYINRVEQESEVRTSQQQPQQQDVMDWYQISMMLRATQPMDLDQQTSDRTLGIVQRKFQTQDIDIYTAIDVIKYVIRVNHHRRDAVISMCLQSLTEGQISQHTKVSSSAILQLLYILQSNQIFSQYPQLDSWFEELFDSHDGLSTPYQKQQLIELFKDKPLSKKLQQFIQQIQSK